MLFVLVWRDEEFKYLLALLFNELEEDERFDRVDFCYRLRMFGGLNFFLFRLLRFRGGGVLEGGGGGRDF